MEHTAQSIADHVQRMRGHSPTVVVAVGGIEQTKAPLDDLMAFVAAWTQ